MDYKDVQYIANEGTDEAHEVTVTLDTVTKEAEEAVAKASDEYSEYLGMTYRESAIGRYGKLFFDWFSINTCSKRAKRAFGDDEIAMRYAGFLASASLRAYEDALRDGKSGEAALDAAEDEAYNVDVAFTRHMLEDVRGMMEELDEL